MPAAAAQTTLMRQEIRSTNSDSVIVWTNLVADMTRGDLHKFSDIADPSRADFFGGVGLAVADTGPGEGETQTGVGVSRELWTTWGEERRAG